MWPALPLCERALAGVGAGKHDLRIAFDDCLHINRWRKIGKIRKNIAAAAKLDQFANVMFAVDGEQRSPRYLVEHSQFIGIAGISSSGCPEPG